MQNTKEFNKKIVGVDAHIDPQTKKYDNLNANPVGADSISAREKGITLIALIITIIVMLILAGVTVNVSLNGGLFDSAKKARQKTEMHEICEQLIAAIQTTSDGKINVGAIVSVASEMYEEVDGPDAKGVLTIKGKHATYQYSVTEKEIKIIGIVGADDSGEGDPSGEPGENPGQNSGGNPGEDETDIPQKQKNEYGFYENIVYRDSEGMQSMCFEDGKMKMKMEINGLVLVNKEVNYTIKNNPTYNLNDGTTKEITGYVFEENNFPILRTTEDGFQMLACTVRNGGIETLAISDSMLYPNFELNPDEIFASSQS